MERTSCRQGNNIRWKDSIDQETIDKISDRYILQDQERIVITKFTFGFSACQFAFEPPEHSDNHKSLVLDVTNRFISRRNGSGARTGPNGVLT
jgi:hypothetical protein